MYLRILKDRYDWYHPQIKTFFGWRNVFSSNKKVYTYWQTKAAIGEPTKFGAMLVLENFLKSSKPEISVEEYENEAVFAEAMEREREKRAEEVLREIGIKTTYGTASC